MVSPSKLKIGMFTEPVEMVFQFLESDYEFKKQVITPRKVRYSKNGVYISLTYSNYDEVSMTCGLKEDKNNLGFSSNLFSELSDPMNYDRRVDYIGNDRNGITQALRDHAKILTLHGQRILNAEHSVFNDLQNLVRRKTNERRIKALREKANIAFSNNDYATAYQYYIQLNTDRNRLDEKRLHICNSRLNQ